MKTHILFLKEGTYGYNSEYVVNLITEQWHIDCNNFKGSSKECEFEAKKQKQRDFSFFEPQQYVFPHYVNAEYKSIFDY
jgi:hypothetical protein